MLISNFTWVKNKNIFKIFKKLIFNFIFIASLNLNFRSYLKKKILSFLKKEKETGWTPKQFFSIGPRPKFPVAIYRFPHRDYSHSHWKVLAIGKFKPTWESPEARTKNEYWRILVICVFSRMFFLLYFLLPFSLFSLLHFPNIAICVSRVEFKFLKIKIIKYKLR